MLLERVLDPGQAGLQDGDDLAVGDLILMVTFPLFNQASLVYLLCCEFSWCHDFEKSGIMLSALTRFELKSDDSDLDKTWWGSDSLGTAVRSLTELSLCQYAGLSTRVAEVNSESTGLSPAAEQTGCDLDKRLGGDTAQSQSWCRGAVQSSLLPVCGPHDPRSGGAHGPLQAQPLG